MKVDESIKIRPSVRLLLAIVALPSLLGAAIISYSISLGDWDSLTVNGVIFLAIGLLGCYLAFTGRMPNFLRRFYSDK